MAGTKPRSSWASATRAASKMQIRQSADSVRRCRWTLTPSSGRPRQPRAGEVSRRHEPTISDAAQLVVLACPEYARDKCDQAYER